eukprot:394383-Hanusia_phi.AAC.1
MMKVLIACRQCWRGIVETCPLSAQTLVASPGSLTAQFDTPCALTSHLGRGIVRSRACGRREEEED